MTRRQILTSDPPLGDYILTPTGVTWGIGRTNGNGSVMRVSAGERSRKVAVETLLSLAAADRADAWETVGTGYCWLIKRHRSAS